MTMRSVAYVGAVALLAQVLLSQGCGGGNSPATAVGTGGATTPVTTGAGGATTPVTTGYGGTTTPATGAGGTTTASTSFDPLCSAVPLTAAGAAPTKNGLCIDTDPQLCYKSCGPNSIGFKSETCTAGVYVEQSGCNFLPNTDYSCYKIPTTMDPSCPTLVPQASTPCNGADAGVSVPTCTLCNVNGGYLDSSGAAKTGYCVCPTPSATTGTAKWSCASSTAWPCPAGQGC